MKLTYNQYWKYIERPKRILESFINRLFKMDNAKLLQRDANKHRYELVWDSPFEVVRLIGWTDQYEDDYYWIVYSRRDGIRLMSCVGGLYWMKTTTWSYRHSNEIFELNCPLDYILDEVRKKGIIVK